MPDRSHFDSLSLAWTIDSWLKESSKALQSLNKCHHSINDLHTQSTAYCGCRQLIGRKETWPRKGVVVTVFWCCRELCTCVQKLQIEYLADIELVSQIFNFWMKGLLISFTYLLIDKTKIKNKRYVWEENQPFSLSVYNEWHSLRIFSFTVTVAESVEFAEALDFILPDIMQFNKEAHSPLCVEDLLPSWIQFLYRMWFGHKLLLCSNISKIIFSNLIFIPNSLF